MIDRELLLSIIKNLETELKALDLWEATMPPAQAFESEIPFFHDTMQFHQWLQWVFIARFRAIIEGEHELPARCDIAPMAEEYFKTKALYADPVIGLLRRFDQQFSATGDAASGS
ncbi:MAG: YqcC family protein [Ketobacter sp.]